MSWLQNTFRGLLFKNVAFNLTIQVLNLRMNWGQTLFEKLTCELACVRDWSTAEGVPKRSEGMER